MAFSGAAAVFISYCTAWTVRTTSSTTFVRAPSRRPSFWPLVSLTNARFVLQSMVGALNKLPVAASGILFFGDPATFANVSSILVGFFAGLVVRQRSLLLAFMILSLTTCTPQYSAAKTAQSAAAKR